VQGSVPKLRATLEDGEAAVNLLIRTYDADVADHHTAVADIALRHRTASGPGQDMARGSIGVSIHDIGEIGIAGPTGRSDGPDPGIRPLTIPAPACSIVDGISPVADRLS